MNELFDIRRVEEGVVIHAKRYIPDDIQIHEKRMESNITRFDKNAM